MNANVSFGICVGTVALVILGCSQPRGYTPRADGGAGSIGQPGGTLGGAGGPGTGGNRGNASAGYGGLSGMRQEEVPAAMSPLVVLQVPIRRDGEGSEALAPVEGQAECLKAASVAGAWREVHLE